MDEFGKIIIQDDIQWIFSFTHPEKWPEEHIFGIFKIDALSETEKESFKEFWAAKSPYIHGEYINTLEVSDSLIQHVDKITGYVESILLHELMDHDDSEDSMLTSEQYVMDKIYFSATLSPQQRMDVVKHHIWFFQWNKAFYEKQFTTYKEYYEDHVDDYKATLTHYEKICAVANYLERLLSSRETTDWQDSRA